MTEALKKKCDPSKHLHLIIQNGYVNNGYVIVGTHDKACKFGKHRLILLDKIGPGEHPCHHCGTTVSWDASIHREPTRALVIDHLDFDKLNNDPSNLVPSCNMCNSTRNPEHQLETIEHNGETVTVKAMADRVGLSRGAFKRRLLSGMTVDEALSMPRQRVPLTHNGQTLSLAQWARRTGISQSSLHSRLAAGWTTEQALMLPVGSRVKRVAKPKPVRIDTRKRITFNGHTRTLDEWATVTGLPYDAIRIRLRRGWSIERALTTGVASPGHSQRAA